MISTFSVAAQGGDTVVYQYDERGRLTSAQRSGASSAVAQYAYDRSDNRTSVIVSGAGPGPASSITVANFSFEEPSVGAGFQYNPAVAGATFSGMSGVAGNGSAWMFAAAPAGTQVGFLQSASGNAGLVSLTVSGLVPGQSYVAQLRIARRPVGDVNTLRVRFNGLTVGNFTPASTSFAQVTTQAFTATSSSGTLALSVLPTAGDSSVGVDQIIVVPAP